MKDRKTRKLICNISGKQLFASKDYYNKKVQKIGSEDELHTTYMCKEARDLVKKGLTLEKIRDVLHVDSNFKSTLTIDQARKLVNGNSLRINISEQTAPVWAIKTDPDVAQFIKNITSDE